MFFQIDSIENPIDINKQMEIMESYVEKISPEFEKILILPPDYTRKHSGAGKLTAFLYDLLKDDYEISIMPALGTHTPMPREEIIDMFGTGIPFELFEVHDFENDTVKIGKIPEEFVVEVSEGVVKQSIEVNINQKIVNGDYDLVISIGQVLPHAVVGMANYNKNIFVGCGGIEMIDISHFVGAVYGMERLLGKDHSPVRKLFDYAQEKMLGDINLDYILTVNSTNINPQTGTTDMLGLFIGQDRQVFEKAVKLSQEYNIVYLDKPLDKVVVYMDEEEFKSTWLCCKAIYRTRLAIADSGQLIVIAPGLKKFGEYDSTDNLIRKYGYRGRDQIVEYVKENQDLRANLAAAAHLIHGSSEGRFSVFFATDQLSKEELEGVNFKHISLKKVFTDYPLDELKYGYNKPPGGEEIFYIDNPTTGLWSIN
ncbi:MAG: DUF2088 domain-containing protein [Firmicutes bacterium]|nr:DUF2088 domain-containing protein [Bacillota bacterium]